MSGLPQTAVDAHRQRLDHGLTFNYDPEDYGSARNFGHLAYEVDNIYDTYQRLLDRGVVINRSPRDGNMVFVRSPDLISI